MSNTRAMTQALTNILVDGETLTCPIFGAEGDDFPQYAYFAFTETHFLVAYLTGKQVTKTERIPLDIKSVRIKKTKILGRYIIDVVFGKNRSFKITASPKVLTIASQKENLPLFIKHLEAIAKSKATELDEVEGEKLRWQYFNTLIYTLLAFFPAVPVMIIIEQMKEGNFDVLGTLSEMSGALPTVLTMYACFIGPLVVLSLLNRFFFGKTLGVVNQSALYLENCEIPLERIEKIVYHPRVMSRTRIVFSYAVLHLRTNRGTKQMEIVHFPMYALWKIKKYNPQIKLKCDSYIWFLIFIPTVVFAIIALLV